MEFFNKNRQLINIIVLGISFLFIFGAFTTSSMFQTTILNAEKVRTNGTFTGNGFTSLAIIYLTFAFSNWVAPIVVVWLTPKYSMFVSGIIYGLFIFSFLRPMTPLLYTGSVLLGIAAAILWTAQGNYLSINSNSATISRNTGIFWVLFQSSLVWGNIIQYALFRDTETITVPQRTQIYLIFGSCEVVGVFLVLLLRSPTPTLTSYTEISDNNSSSVTSELLIVELPEKFTPLQAFLQSFHLIKTKPMLLLFVPFAYTGFELTFFSGVYGTAVGQTLAFGNYSKGYIGLIGIAIGVGEMTSSILCSTLTRLWKKIAGPDFIIVIGITVHLICFFLVFLNLPFDSNIQPSDMSTFIEPSASVAILCGYLLGFGDSVFNTQLIALLGDYYRGVNSPAAFALFKFMQSLTSAIGFFYSTYLNLQWQLLILVVTGVLGTITFIVMERSARQLIATRNFETSINENPDHSEDDIDVD